MTSGWATLRSAAQGDASQVEHGEHVGVELLVRQAEADDVEGGQRMARSRL